MLDSVDMDKVELRDSFWKPKTDVNHTISLPHQYNECERTGRIDNFRIAGGLKKGEITKFLAADSDVYKWIEAASYSLVTYPDPDLESKLNQVIGLIAGSQEESGYLNTSFLFGNRDKRWKDLSHGHELYCGGHLIQAAIAHHRATGVTDLLDVALKWADYVCDYFGPDAHIGTGGHPEVEMALVELYRETGKERYLDLAIFFIEGRGKRPPLLDGSEQLQDHLPIREQTYVTGHAVRQLYLLCGVTDIYAEIGDRSLFEALEKQWDDFVNGKMSITGGAGARYAGEAFGEKYELPNRTAYNETCAAIASLMWNWRMLQVTGDARYSDIMERVLYNGFLSGVSLDGLSYFYTNPLEHDGGRDLAGAHRGSNRRTTKHWDHTACCPPNAARVLASVKGYIYGEGEDALYVHLYAASSAEVEIRGTKVRVVQRTDYPWDGRVEIDIDPEVKTEFNLSVRIPGWAENPEIRINGGKTDVEPVPGTYLGISRLWSPGDTLTLELPMPVVRMASDPRVTCNSGCVALMRGPIVYCIEGVDHPGVDLFSIVLPRDSELEPELREDLLGGVVVLQGEALSNPLPEDLYSPIKQGRRGPRDAIGLTAVPYFSWANREPGAMRVWIPVC